MFRQKQARIYLNPTSMMGWDSWDWPTGILIMIIRTSHSQKNVFEWESSFWNKILLQWWGWIIGAVYFSRAFLLLLRWYVLSYRRLGFQQGLTNRYFDNDDNKDESHPKIFFEWEASFWNKILLQWWGWIVEGAFLLLLLIRFVVPYRRFL